MRKIIFILLIGILLPSSCHKKEKEEVAGTYIGEERFTDIGPYDTLSDTTYSQSITLTLTEKNKFTVTKSTYPFSYEISANGLIKHDSITLWKGFPSEVWTIWLNGNELNGNFEINNNWAGSKEHYKFSGSK